MKWLQKLGKALMLPVACLPICGILMGIGYLLCPSTMQGGDVVGFAETLGFFLVKAGAALIDNIAILFVIGVGVGMSDKNDGTGGLAALASWLMMTTLLSTGVVTTIMPSMAEKESAMLAFGKIANPFIGILAGVIGSTCYNKFKSTKLPDWLAFFSGKRCVAIIAGVIIFGFDNSHIAYSPVSDNIFCAGTSPATLFILIHPDFFLNCFKKIIVPGLLIRLQFTRAWAVSGNQMCRSCDCKTPEGTLYKHSAVLKKNRKPLLRGASDVPGFSCRRALSIFNFLYLSNGGLFPSIRM